ncbi:DUF2905 domain-containing protein [Lacibacter sp.]|uniref:DUF2905 domain-containing protein n=1 Tax=Lacibacter sp. TaxID=1915409 RepID=UPI002B4B00A7|nr:DUF2905 domain-containing protein [Lacibacter sp.]HLP35986.1 DUF2905 domain-containing protein [Lacibacter sp.]
MLRTEAGKWIIIAGLLIVLIGVIIYFFHDKLGWIGRLPGDIRIERENVRFYFPFTTMLLLSVVVSLLIRLIKRFFL